VKLKDMKILIDFEKRIIFLTTTYLFLFFFVEPIICNVKRLAMLASVLN